MNAIQKMESIRRDEACRAIYAEYLQLRAGVEKARVKRRKLISRVALPMMILLTLMTGVNTVTALLWVLLLIVFVASEVGSGQNGKSKERAWAKSGVQIVRSAVPAYFEGCRFDAQIRQENRKDILTQIIASDKRIYDHMIKGEWRGKNFCAYHAELLRDGGEDADTTLFEGLILEVEASPELDASLAARLDNREYKVYVAKKIKGEEREMRAQEIQQIFHHRWMTELVNAANRVPVMACVKTEYDRCFVQVGIGGLPCVAAEETGASYDAFVNGVAESLERVQRLLDAIISNQLLFERRY